MPRPLPSHPNLRQLKLQTKDQLKAHSAGDAQASERIVKNLPRCAENSDKAVGSISLQESQHVIACDYGFKHWNMLWSVVNEEVDLLAYLKDDEIQKLQGKWEIFNCIHTIRSVGSLFAERLLSNMSLRVRTFMLEEIELGERPAADQTE